MVKEILVPILRQAFDAARAKGDLQAPACPDLLLENPPNEGFGDYSSNLAMLLARAERKPPLVIAERLREGLPAAPGVISEVRIEKPGFLNFYLETGFLAGALNEVLTGPAAFGRNALGAGKSVLIEFVSANPTGPLHVGHGRGAAVGDVLARILDASGFRVHREYYINDTGSQMRMLGTSTHLRYLESKGVEVAFPEDGYQGDYIREIAASPAYIDKVAAAGGEFDEERRISVDVTGGIILEEIRKSLKEFQVVLDEWYSERSLYESGKVDEAVTALEKASKLYEKDGAKWLKTSDYGDEKDRVVIREDGRPTYLASDIAYHLDKYERGFDRFINIWGADHHGYLPRIRASIEMLGNPPDRLDVLFVQFVSLRRGGEPVQMSTRAGQFEELAGVVDEVGVDAARFFFLMRSPDSALEFDLDLAKEESSENPVYYVQYAHARTCSLFQQAEARGVSAGDLAEVPAGGLALPEEHRLLRAILEWPGVVRTAAERLEPHRLPYALVALAKQFHAYYNRNRILVDDPAVARARLCLAKGVQAVAADGLKLLGVNAPEKM